MTMRILDHSSIALSGMNLIQASAGTGKTYAIASLYLRLLVEKELQPEEILVVTYTEAATQELRSRIRKRIREALDAMRGEATDDHFLSGFCDQAVLSGTAQKAAGALEAALAAFDTASIFTIHGFCLRALQDNAFESGSLYDTELVPDQSMLAREVVDDFWRERFFTDRSPLLGYALEKKCSPNAFMKLLRELNVSARVEVLPQYSESDISTLETNCSALFVEVCRIWRQERESVSLVLKEDRGLSRAESAYRLDRVGKLLAEMESFVETGNPFGLFKGFGKMTASGIMDGTKPTGTAPQHALFDACQRLMSAVDERLLALKAEMVAFFRKRLPERKREGNLRFFDDLLEDLYKVLADGPESAAMAEALRKRYKAALIDEFQDTDPLQYDIFRTIYAESDAPLFLIGDPKQAIYSFRGADIFAYLKAAADVCGERRFTLNSNWRSVPKLLRGFNILFDSTHLPFVLEEIPSPPLVPGKTDVESGDAEEPPLEICLMDSGSNGGIMKSGEAESFASAACAAGVAGMIRDGKADAAQIAVIVRTHRQARLAQAALRAQGVPTVMRSDESVFASREAEDVRITVTALADPGRQPQVRAALVTPLFGLTGSDIDRLNHDESAWANWLQQFNDYHRIWLEQGFMVMARELMRREAVRERLLAVADSSGDRSLTNVLHCFELLHRHSHDHGLGMEGLVSWFSERVASKEPGDEYQIRLESDESAVRIVTVHVSKGLQYPVVFCPFLFAGGGSGGDVVLFHDKHGHMVKDFGSAGIAGHRAMAARESLAESMRLLYVALTRAERRCVFFTGRVIDGSRRGGLRNFSPTAYLLYVSDAAKQRPEVVDAARSEFDAMDAEAMAGVLQELSDGSGGSIGFRRLASVDAEQQRPLRPVAPAGQVADRRRFHTKLESDWRISSFTSFSRHQHKAYELPDRDESELEQRPAIVLPEGDRTVFSFHRGARAGLFMHSIFESLDFAAPSESALAELVEKGLDRYGFDRSWQHCMVEKALEVLTVQLSSHGGSFTLGGLKQARWITELEFFFPLKRLASPELAEVLVRHGAMAFGVDLASVAAALDFKPVKGMLLGFMDMVFEADGKYWLLDWKSNHLGNSPDDYRAESLRQAMTGNLYPLQYLLYTVALDRYLSLRVPGYSYATHFGGVIYVFLRGVSASNGEQTGFFRDLPPEALIRELGAILIEKGEES
ncbi:MAG: exodeoxyribonuclease V subunit beta [Chlorobiaceae bacterium]|nr:exodeoxyribonuclease V subunit beta [Chlorobiaceae bacterium]